MSAFNNTRRAPNVSQYIHGLNTIPPTQDIHGDIGHIGDDLDFLAHADFFDFDSFNPNNNVDHAGHDHTFSPTHGEQKRPNAAVNNAAFQFGEFQTYPPTVGSSPASATGLHGAYPPQPHHTLPYDPQAGDKRKASISVSQPSPQDYEEQSRMAAEEDKRRRNTAASARFRIKKKQREQALEKQAKEMTDKVNALEGKVQQLEMENKWLKGLITEKSDGKPGADGLMEKEGEERSPEMKKKGVGTEEVKDEA